MTTTPAAVPASIPLTVRGGSASAGRPYLVGASLAGHVPATVLPGGTLPLELDPFSKAILQLAGGPAAPGFLGVLDGRGEASAALVLPAFTPLPPGSAGLRISLASWVYRAPLDLRGGASNPVDVVLR